MASMTPLEIWPVFGLRIRTPRVELRPVAGDVAFALADLAAQGIHDPAVMPFLMPWTDQSPPELQRESMRHYWSTWANFRVERWSLPFAVYTRDDHGEARQLVGTQSVHEAVDFPLLRTFDTGSWVGQRFQGQGIGKEMRQAVLHFMFAGLGAQEATTAAFEDNAASLGVTRSLGYEANGAKAFARRAEKTTECFFRLTSERWEAGRRDDIELEGLDERCLAFFGLGPDLAPLPT